MKTAISPTSFTLWLSAADTRAWARKPGAAWPCGTVAGHRFKITFNETGVTDLTRDGRYPSQHVDLDENEFSAQVADAMRDKLPADHPCRFVAVGQFEK